LLQRTPERWCVISTRTVSVRLQAEIGQYVSGMSKAAAATMRVADSGKKAQESSSKGFDVAGKGALIFGGAVVAGLGLAIKKSMDFEKSMSGIQAATQASGATMEALRATAIKAGADTMYSATEAADAITEMAKAGVSAKDIMGGGLTGALNLAAAGQMDVADAAGIASTAMTQFRLTGAQLPHVADLLAAGAGKAMGSVDDLGQALNQAGLLASSSGISIEETTGTLAAFASAGLIGSDAGTSFKTMLQQLQAPSQQSAQLMQQLGINAYDAQGNFVGLAGLAQQLKDKLGPLTQAERDHALAQIFGSDAARAASVLYREGAKGIEDWTKKVNDAGYAQRQAAQMTDNLSGDLERLGGSFDTFLISAGSGSQGPLRALVQGLTGIVNAAGDLVTMLGAVPAPVWLMVGALTAAKLLSGPLTKGFQGIGFAVDVFKASAQNAGGPVSALKGSLGGIASSINPVSLAITGATLLIPALIDGFKSLTQVSDAAKQAQQTYVEVLKEQNGVLNESVRQAAAKAAQDAGVLDAAQRAGVSLSLVTDALLGNKDAYAQVRGELGRSQEANVGNGKALESTRQAIMALDKLAPTVGETARQQRQLGDATGQTGAAMGQQAGAAAAAAPKVDTYKQSLQDASQAASDAKTQTDLFKLSLDILTGKMVETAQVEAAFYEAASQATGAMKGLHGSVLDAAGGLNVQSESGRKAQGILFNVRDAGNQVIATMIKHGATEGQVIAKDAELRATFIKTAQQMGISAGDAQHLADKIYGIPASRTTSIKADIKSASDAVDTVQRKINGITGKTVVINAEYATNGALRTGHAVAGFAGGGYTGPGGKYEPKGVVHGGEYVFTKEETARAGVGNLAHLAQSLRGYAGGGYVPVNVDFTPAYSAVHRMMAMYSSAPGRGSGAEQWRGVVLRVLSMLGQSPLLANGILRMIQAESGGNPRAINLTDSNARAGHPSQGLMQTIPSTFYAYAGALAGRGITDPLANIYAGVNYALHRYGASMLARGGNRTSGGAYAGYKTGTDYVPEDGLAYLHKGERVVTAADNAAMRSRETSWGASTRPVVNVAAPSLDGMKISGTVAFDPSGMLRFVDAQIVEAFDHATTWGRS